MPRQMAAHSGGMNRYEILLSSASETTRSLVSGSLPSWASATIQADVICRAQLGLEFEVVTRSSEGGPWRSGPGETAREVIDRRFA